MLFGDGRVRAGSRDSAEEMQHVLAVPLAAQTPGRPHPRSNVCVNVWEGAGGAMEVGGRGRKLR